jgi:DNA-binding NarL/FixJ family response regulator
MVRTIQPRVLLADSDPLWAQGCKDCLQPEFEVVGIVGDARSLVESVSLLKPNVVVVDADLPLLHEAGRGRALKHVLRSTKVVYVAASTSPEAAAVAFRNRASAYLPKATVAAEIVSALHDALQGKHYLSPAVPAEASALLSENKPEPDATLTPRQRQVLQLLAEGRTMKEVGFALNLTPRTVAFHKYKIMALLGLENSAELVRYAMREHLVSKD